MPDVTFLAAASEGHEPRKRIQVAEIGRFKDPRYGTFAITDTDVANWRRLLFEHFDGRVPIDRDHATDKGTSSEAMAWITSLEQDGEKVMADVEWTPTGEQLVRNGSYRYISPTFVSSRKDKQGRDLGPALLRAALTNNPFLHDMPAVSLDASIVPPAFAERDPAVVRDTRSVMSTLAPIAKALGLDETADETKILEAIAEQAKKSEPAPVTLDQAAAIVLAEGKVLLDKGEHDKLTTDAAKAGALETRVVTLETERKEERFTLAFDKALEEGRVDAKPETREGWKAQFDATGDTALTLLASLPAVINLDRGTQGGREHAAGAAPDGYDAESYELDQKVQAHLLEHPDVDYPTALNRVMATQES